MNQITVSKSMENGMMENGNKINKIIFFLSGVLLGMHIVFSKGKEIITNLKKMNSSSKSLKEQKSKRESNSFKRKRDRISFPDIVLKETGIESSQDKSSLKFETELNRIEEGINILEVGEKR